MVYGGIDTIPKYGCFIFSIFVPHYDQQKQGDILVEIRDLDMYQPDPTSSTEQFSETPPIYSIPSGNSTVCYGKWSIHLDC